MINNIRSRLMQLAATQIISRMQFNFLGQLPKAEIIPAESATQEHELKPEQT